MREPWANDPIVQAPAANAAAPWDADPIIKAEQPTPPSTAPSINFTKPARAVRAEIARLPKEQQDAAMRAWADAVVASERKAPGIGTAIDDTVRTVARGTFMGPLADELQGVISSAAYKASGGALGAPYDETVAYQRAKDRALDAEAPGFALAGKIVGGVAGGGAALKAAQLPGAIASVGRVAVAGPLGTVAPATTALGRLAQGALIGGTYGFAQGAGNAEGTIDQRVAEGAADIAPGAILGAAAPAAIAAVGRGANAVTEAVSPTVARWSANARDKLAIKASAGGNSSTPGADAAAERVIANQLVRGGVKPGELSSRLTDLVNAKTFGPGNVAADQVALVDLDPSLMRLAGSVGRQSPEAQTMMQSAQYARQTGTPSGLPMPQAGNIATREAFTERAASAPPAGQYERVKDALRRALEVPSSASAYAAEKQMIAAQKSSAQQLYGEAYKAARGVDVAPLVAPVLAKWEARLAGEIPGIAKPLKDAIAQFQTKNGPVRTLEQFDKAKRFLDDKIGGYFSKLNSGNSRTVGGALGEFQRDMIAALDAQPGFGAKYAAARDKFGSEQEMIDAIALGRSVFRENAEVAADQYNALSSGQKALFRLGLFDGADKAMAGRKRTDDITALFDNPRVQDLIPAIVPNPENAARFGKLLSLQEKKFIQTRNKTIGGSPTKERMADDEALNGLQSMIEQAKSASAGGKTGLAMRAIEGTINKLFGFRADTAAALAEKLFTASPAERANLVAAIEFQMGPTRGAHLLKLLGEYRSAATQGGVAASQAVQTGGNP